MSRSRKKSGKKKKTPAIKPADGSAAEQALAADKTEEPETKSETESETEPETESETESETEPETETESEPAPEPATEPSPEPGSEPEDNSYDAVLSRLKASDVRDNGFTSSPPKKGGVFSLLLYLIFIGVFVVTAFMLGQNIYAKLKGGQIYGEIADIFEGGGEESGHASFMIPRATPTLGEMIEKGGSGGVSGGDELARVRASLTSLSQTNPDTFGWITIPGTVVNYPVVRGTDNDWYLDHAYTGDSLPVGSIFADYRTEDSVFDNVNLVIYGHNVNDGSMFGSLSDHFVDQEFFDSCRIYLYTSEGIFIYRPFSVHEPAEDSAYIRTWFTDVDDYLSFLKWLEDDSVFKATDFSPDETMRIITLSTCTGRGSEQRFAVHAALVSFVTD